MELSPASPNVGYFLVYPEAWWEADPHLGDSSAISRASAAAIIAEPTSVATADIYGFDWVPDMSSYPDGSVPDNPVIWTNFTPEFFPGSDPGPDQITQHPDVSFRNYGSYDTPNYRAYNVGWFSAFAFGGTNVVMDPDGGVNAMLVEVTVTDAADLLRIGAGSPSVSDDFRILCSASSDGGQTFGVWANYLTPISDFDEVFARIKVWRLPTRIWPVEPPEPSSFWTGFISARETP